MGEKINKIEIKVVYCALKGPCHVFFKHFRVNYIGI